MFNLKEGMCGTLCGTNSNEFFLILKGQMIIRTNLQRWKKQECIYFVGMILRNQLQLHAVRLYCENLPFRFM